MRTSESRYEELRKIFEDICADATKRHAGVLMADDLAAAAKMSPESSRRWLRTLCRAHGYQWVEGRCLCPSSPPVNVPEEVVH
mgnify:CR=1 FL=1